jgi:hypothetical protein
LPSTGDWAEERDPRASDDPKPPGFDAYANSDCVYCVGTTEKKTAEVLYMSLRWDYYYCYKCRGWFKRYYGNAKVFLPVRDEREVRSLTQSYLDQMRSIYERGWLYDKLAGYWHTVGRRSHRTNQDSA